MNIKRKAKKAQQLGDYYLDRGLYQLSIDNYLKAAAYANTKQSYSESLYHRISYVFYLQWENTLALEFIEKCLELSPWYLDGQLFYWELLHLMWEKEKGLSIMRNYEKKMKDLHWESLDLDAFYNQ